MQAIMNVDCKAIFAVMPVVAFALLKWVVSWPLNRVARGSEGARPATMLTKSAIAGVGCVLCQVLAPVGALVLSMSSCARPSLGDAWRGLDPRAPAALSCR